MRDLLELAVSNEVLPFTILLAPIFIYWGFCLLGLLDLDFLDIDFESDTEISQEGLEAEAGSASSSSSGFLDQIQGVMKFMNAADVPVMVVLSFLVVVLWVFIMVGHLAMAGLNLPFFAGWWPLTALVGSTFLTKGLTAPLSPLFTSFKEDEAKDPIIGKTAVVRTSSLSSRGGQVKLEHRGGTTYLNARTPEGSEDLPRDTEVLIYKYDGDSGEYLVRSL